MAWVRFIDAQRSKFLLWFKLGLLNTVDQQCPLSEAMVDFMHQKSTVHSNNVHEHSHYNLYLFYCICISQDSKLNIYQAYKLDMGDLLIT